MSDIDPRMRDALRGLAEDAPSGSDELWTATQRRIGQRRRRRTAASAVASGLTAVAVIVGVIAIASERDEVEVGDITTTTTSNSTIAPAVLDSGDRVVARTDGTIEIVDANWEARADGVIAELGDRYVRQLAVAPDGDRVYYLADHDPGPYGSDCADLYVVGVDTAPTLIAHARSFALAPNGNRIALGAHRDRDGECAPPDGRGGSGITMIDAQTLEPITEWDAGSATAQIESIAWEATSSRLAARVCEGMHCEVVVVGVSGDEMGPGAVHEPPGGLDEVAAITWGDGPLWALEWCCDEADNAGEVDPELLAEVVKIIDVDTGTVLFLQAVADVDELALDLTTIDGGVYMTVVTGFPGDVHASLDEINEDINNPVADDVTAVAPVPAR